MKTILSRASLLAVVAVMTAVLPAASTGHRSPLVIPAAAFHEIGEHPNSFYYHPNGYLTGDGETVWMVAGVYLPAGATIQRVALHGYDNSDSCEDESLAVYLARRHQGTNVAESMAFRTSDAGASSAMQHLYDYSIDHPFVDNISYEYFVQVRLCSPSHRVYSVVIDYTE